MNYKVDPGTELFEKLKVLQWRMISADKAAKDLCKLLAGKEAVPLHNPRCIAGGLDAIHNTAKPNMDIWRHVGRPENENYYPKPINKVTVELFESLPRVEYKELNAILGYFGNQVVRTKKGKMVIRGAYVNWHHDFILVKIHQDTKYTPKPEMVAIEDEEYYELMERIIVKK